jgi:cytochrome c oxidase subunit 4
VAPYVVVWLLLLVLTGVTVWTGHMHLGSLALPLALTIATTKSLLVLIIFMHLKEDKGANRLVVGTAFIFVLLLLGIVLGDVATRFKPLSPAHAPFGAKVHLPEGAAQHAAPHH